MRATDDLCPKCSGEPEAVETATARFVEPTAVDLVLVCGCGVRWTVRDLGVDEAIGVCRAALRRQAWAGATHAALGMLLEASGRPDEAYERLSVALRCPGRFDRAFCWERRGAYEARHGWLRNALHAFRLARAEDASASGAREATYRDAIGFLEQSLAARDIAFPPPGHDDARWARERELELPPGFGLRNERGQPLADAVIEVERRLRAERWDDAVAALQALSATDVWHLVDAIGFASRGAALALEAGRRDAAIALQALVVHGYVVWASGSRSGAEGLARSAEVERERAKLRALEGG